MAVLFLLTLTLPLSAIDFSAATENSWNTSDITKGSPRVTNTSGGLTNTTTSNSAEGISNTDTTSIQNTSNSTSAAYGEGAATLTAVATTIKVLIYSGTYASTNCVNGMKTALDYANANNLVPGVTFTYATSTSITSAILSAYDVLAMPGGDGGKYYLGSSSISASAIKNFVSNGGGYLGICAGAYSGSYYVDGMYYGWGVAPHVRCKVVSYAGKLPITITTAGQELLGYGGTLTLSHYNGAAMYVSNGAVVFANYADSSTGYKNYAAIVGDYYGNGRSVLIGPHPELSPQNPDLLAHLIAWAANVSADSGTDTNTSTTVTMSQVNTAAATVKSYYETNGRLPNYVTINNQQVSMSSFLYLLTTGTIKASSGSTAAITLKNVNAATNESGTIKSGNIQKSEFLTIAQNIKSFIETNGRAPNNVATSLGTMKFSSVVYMFSKIMNYYKTYSRLPNYVSMTA